MIEAVTSSISNSQLVRQVAEQTATTQSFSSNPTRVQSAAVVAPYLSPHVDLNGGSPIFVVRDAETGENIRQFPTEGQIKAYRQAQAQSQARQQQAQVDLENAQAKQVGEAQQKSADIVKSSVEYRQVVRQDVKVQQPEVVPGQKTTTATKSAGTTTTTDTAAVATDNAPAKVITSLDTQA